jgi:hypothetical protein
MVWSYADLCDALRRELDLGELSGMCYHATLFGPSVPDSRQNPAGIAVLATQERVLEALGRLRAGDDTFPAPSLPGLPGTYGGYTVVVWTSWLAHIPDWMERFGTLLDERCSLYHVPVPHVSGRRSHD